MAKYISFLLLIFSIIGCSGKETVKPAETFDAEKSFAKANKHVDEKEYDEARALYLTIKNRDLSKKFGPLSQLRIADSYVQEEEPDRAVAEFKRFLEMYPDHKHAPYAQYQIAMVYFHQIESPERGYGGAARALAEFQKLKKNYPRNPFKDQVELRIRKCRNVMGDYEFLVGEFYQKREAYSAAIGRYEYLLKNFPEYKGTAAVLLNLGILHKQSGQHEKATAYFSRLSREYPDAPQTVQAKKELSVLKSDKE
jgi:outer membrane protein assembly factor BamD